MLEITPRIGLVVWLYSVKQIKALRHYGTVMYVSRRMKYAYLYVDAVAAPTVMAKLAKLRFVKRVEPSHRPEVDMDFADRVGKLAAGEHSAKGTKDVEEDNARY
ncbi:YlbG family protein [Lacticaseibacillus nasuensis]|nr:YlbG family protein [Lacticaseibacillus nasuensis]MCX2456478.1 YlbG family protein [Lacticaseibacillus nasuensis]